MLINGHISESFLVKRGLQQGCPFSLFLFIQYAKGLSSRISGAIISKVIDDLKGTCGYPVICHLFSADDSLFFAKANKNATRVWKRILHQYERVQVR